MQKNDKPRKWSNALNKQWYTLDEDGDFGNFLFTIDQRKISRDLIDSIIEIYFLEGKYSGKSLCGSFIRSSKKEKCPAGRWVGSCVWPVAGADSDKPEHE